MRTLAKFHRVAPASVNMSSYGKPTGFYNRQISLFKTLCKAQAETLDVETQQPVGKIPHHEDSMEFFSNPRTQPKDLFFLFYGDYIFENLIFHKMEPRVIGILE